MKLFTVFFVLGLMDLGHGRTMQSATLKKRLKEAKYAFKFRVLSAPSGECMNMGKVTTPSATTTTTTTMASTAGTTTATGTNTVSPSTQLSNAVSTATETFPTTMKKTSTDYITRSTSEISTSTIPPSTQYRANVWNKTATAAMASVHNTTPETSSNNPATVSTKHAPTITITTTTTAKTMTSDKTQQPTSNVTSITSKVNGGNTDIPVTETSPKSETKSGPISPTTQPTTALPNNLASSKAMNIIDFGNLTESSRKKRNCEVVVYHQNIKFLRKRIYKGCKEIEKMRWIVGVNDKYEGNIRLQLGFKGLQKNKNYLFMGRAVPGQDPIDYIFMVDKNTVVPWKPNAMKLKSQLKASKGRC